GRAVAHCDGRTFALEAGDSFLARRGQTHQIVNAGPRRLYALCTMIPDDQFAALIRDGVPAPLDDEDLALLRRLARAGVEDPACPSTAAAAISRPCAPPARSTSSGAR